MKDLNWSALCGSSGRSWHQAKTLPMSSPRLSTSLYLTQSAQIGRDLAQRQRLLQGAVCFQDRHMPEKNLRPGCMHEVCSGCACMRRFNCVLSACPLAQYLIGLQERTRSSRARATKGVWQVHTTQEHR